MPAGGQHRRSDRPGHRNHRLGHGGGQRFDHAGSAVADAIRPLENVLAEADALIRVRLKEIGLEAPHLVIAVTPDDEIVLRSNLSPDILRSFGEDLKNIADELEAPRAPGDETH